MILFVFIVVVLWVLWKLYSLVAYRPRTVRGKSVLITGGGSGIGRLMAIDFAARGARIILWDVNEPGMKAVQEEIVAAGNECTIAAVDVSNRELVYSQAAKLDNRVDVLINNAGIVTGKRFLECPDELMVKTMNVNTLAHFWTIKAFLPKMMEANDGHVVTIASAAGLGGVAGLVDYCASKFGAVGLAEALYMELRRVKKTGVKTTLVCPYYINTGMFDGVKTKNPYLLPILEDRYAASRIVHAVLYGQEFLTMPWLIGIAPVIKVLPAPIAARIQEWLGLSNTMDEFKGRSGSPARTSRASTDRTRKAE